MNQRETGPVAANANMHHPFWQYLHGAAPTLSLSVWLNICDVYVYNSLQVSSLNMLKVPILMPMFVVMWLWLNCACWSLGATRNSRASLGLEVWRMCLAIPGWWWMIYNDLIWHHMDDKYDPNIGWTRTETLWASASTTHSLGMPGLLAHAQRQQFRQGRECCQHLAKVQHQER